MENVKKLQGKTFVVTGASRGIGWEITKKLADNGANVIACSKNENKQFDEKIKELSDMCSVNIQHVYFDMSNPSLVKDGIKNIKTITKDIYGLINNAGVPYLSLVPMISVKDMQYIFQTNFFSQIQLVQGLYREISKSKGVIVNMSSIAAFEGQEGNTLYGTSKACMSLFTKVLAKEMSVFGVRVNCVAPGLCDTDFANSIGDKSKEYMRNNSLLHRLATPQEVANVVLYLTLDDSNFINGQIIRVDGGI